MRSSNAAGMSDSSMARGIGRYQIMVFCKVDNKGSIAKKLIDKRVAHGIEFEKYKDRIPFRRIAEPEEIANVVNFLASDAFSYMTGTTVDVSSGMMMR